MKKFGLIFCVMFVVCTIVILPLSVQFNNEDIYVPNSLLGFSNFDGSYVARDFIEPFSVNSWAINNINASAAWEITTGSPEISVAVIDSGIQANHPSLTNVVCRVLSRDFDISRSNPFVDSYGHGTRVAGLISAQNRGRNTAVAQNIRLVSLRVSSGSGGSINWNWVAEAIKYASSHNIQIINLSLGAVSGAIPSLAFANIRNALESFGGLVVVAAGNDRNNNDIQRNRIYPAGFAYRGYQGFDNLISVGASMSNNRKDFVSGNPVRGSNYGVNSVCIFAPGHQMITTVPNGGYTAVVSHGLWGTSFAAPLVSGTAALMLSVNPYIDIAMLRRILLGSVTSDGVNSEIINNSISGGILNTYKAVSMASTFTLQPTVINTVIDLYRIRNNPFNNFILGRNIYLGSHPVCIDNMNWGSWHPISTFHGTLDGNGYTISGIYIGRNGTNIGTHVALGMFANLYGTVRNLTIVNSHIYVGSNHNGNGWIVAGLVTGFLRQGGIIENVQIGLLGLNSVSIEINRDRSTIGMIAGESHGIIRNSVVSNFDIGGNGDIGGIAGTMRNNGIYNNQVFGGDDIENLAITWYWRVSTNRSIGGIVGFAYAGIVHSNRVENLLFDMLNTRNYAQVRAIVGRNTPDSRVASNTFSNVFVREGSSIRLL